MFSRGIVAAMEDEAQAAEEDEFSLVEEGNQEEQANEIADDFHALGVSSQIENTLQTKVDRGEDLTDEEIVIATETIGNLYLKTSTNVFKGFGFEHHVGKTLTQKEKTKIAMEAITNQNGEKAGELKKKLENFSNSLSDFSSSFSGDTDKIKTDAKTVLDKVKRADDSLFSKSKITDKRVKKVVQRGKNITPFKSYKEVLKSLEDLIDSLRIVSVASKYETFGTGKNSEYDFAKLARDLDSKVIEKTESSVTYDLNQEKLGGVSLTLKLPSDSDNNYLMRNIKANFVVSASVKNVDTQDIEIKPLNKKECIELLESVIKHAEEQEHLFKLYFKDAGISTGNLLKIIAKSLFFSNIAGINSLVYRSRMSIINSKIHYINRDVLRGLIAWAASSMD